MRARRWFLGAWGAVIVVTALRAALAASLPLTGDEAYYWEWSRRLAAGYVDHPPAVAFCIAAFAWVGHSAFAVRIAFVLCGLFAAMFAGGAASALARDERAGAIAALAVTLAPMLTVAFGSATPDGPFALAWAASLYLAVRAFREGRFVWFVCLGIALGAALLSRAFGWALVAGVVAAACTGPYRQSWRRGMAASLAIALLFYAPYLWWNAAHSWISFTFAFLQRHPSDEVQVVRPFVLYALDALAFSPGLWIAATVLLVRRREPLVTWTALPLCIVLLVLSMHERVEVYWFIGPFVSLCVAIGGAFVAWSAGARRRAAAWMFAPAALLTALIFTAGLAPGGVYAAMRAGGIRLADGGPFEMFTYRPLARDVARLTGERGAIAMTDGYGFSSLLDFYAGVRPVVIGYDAQGSEARQWFTDSDRPLRALFVDKVPLASRADFSAQLAHACARVTPGPVLSYRFATADRDVPPRRYFTTWCEGMTHGSVATLRWQRSKS
ncbi:MAG TPA: glycosyltransferase family 39 protein [Candidatus Baltobacteraceae bacterium]|nr:glycosyltransferase family 39 protein [Candidatus Baltobacteraceae bacterium]